MDYEELFFRKSGYDPSLNLNAPGWQRFDTPWGFVVVEYGQRALVVIAMCGNGRKMVPMVEQYAKDCGYSRITFETKRPKAFERRYGYKPVAIVMEKELDNG